MKRVLVIDDETQIRKMLKLGLSGKGYELSEASSGFEGIQAARAIHPDLILLDLGLPDMDGSKVLEELRGWSTIPILILSVRNSEAEIVELLNAGADDYLSKPFGVDMLMARMNAALRRQRPDMREAIVQIGPIVVNLDEHQVSVKGRDIKLTPTEYAILSYLARNAGRIVTQEKLIHELWGPFADASSLRVHVSSLRKKIEEDSSRPRYLVTEPGIGYRLSAS